MELGPILRAMLRNKVGVGLLVFELACTLAVVVNCLSMVIDNRSRLVIPSGLDEPNILAIDELMEAIETDREPQTSLSDGRDAYEMIQAVNAVHIDGGRIDLPLVDRRHPLETWS